MRLLILLLPVFFLLFSCRTIKEVVKVETVYDSTAIRENEKLQKAYQEMIETYERERETWEKTGVVFETEPCPDSTKPETITRIIYDNGKLKSIEGRVKTLNIDLTERTEELYDAHRQIDSLSYQNEKNQVELSKRQTTITKTVERKVLPWWIWLLLATGWIARGYWPRLWKIIKG